MNQILKGAIAIFVGVLILIPGAAGAQTDPSLKPLSTRELAERAVRATYLIVAYDEHSQPLAQGSCFLVDGGYLVTNFHVVSNSTYCMIRSDQAERSHRVNSALAVDRKRDLAVLPAPTDISNGIGLRLAEADDSRVGDPVFVASNPRGLAGTFSDGIVSAVRTTDDGSLLQITAPISPGSSGGAVLNAAGVVVGVAVATMHEGQLLNFAVPVEYLRLLLHESDPSTPTPLNTAAVDAERNAVADRIDGADDVIDLHSFRLDTGDLLFSVHNRTDRPIIEAEMMFIFYSADGAPIESKRAYFYGVNSPMSTIRLSNTPSVSIEPGLAVRCSFFMSADLVKTSTEYLRKFQDGEFVPVSPSQQARELLDSGRARKTADGDRVVFLETRLLGISFSER